MLAFVQPTSAKAADGFVNHRALRGNHGPPSAGLGGRLVAAASPQPESQQQQAFPVFASIAVPLLAVVTFGATWRPSRGSRLRAPHRVVSCRAQIPSRAQGATLRARIWDMLGLDVKAGRDEIKAAYKEYVRLNHPDRNPGDDQEVFADKFQKLTVEYDRVMKMNDDEFWLEAYDTGITRMATKRVDGPSLNAWERRFRQWARERDLLEVDELDDEVDCAKYAELYIERCEEDPEAEGCDIEEMEKLKEMQADLKMAQQADEDITNEYFSTAKPKEKVVPISVESIPRAKPKADDGGIRPDQVFLSVVLAGGAFIFLAVIAIVVNGFSA